MEQIVTVILAIISAVATGGWFVNAKLKKSNEKVDLTDKILQKYQQGVLSVMTDNKEEMKKLNEKLDLIVEFLNGDFVEFCTRKRDEKGRFVETKFLNKRNLKENGHETENN